MTRWRCLLSVIMFQAQSNAPDVRKATQTTKPGGPFSSPEPNRTKDFQAQSYRKNYLLCASPPR